METTGKPLSTEPRGLLQTPKVEVRCHAGGCKVVGSSGEWLASALLAGFRA